MNSKKVIKNAGWIIGARIAQAGLSFLISILTARYLGPSNYGIISYAASLVSFVTPIMYLGINNIIVQDLIENPDEEGKILGSSLFVNFISSLFCIVGVVSFSYICNPNEPTTVLVCLLYSFLLVFQAVDILQYWFQAKLLSKYTSILILLAYVVVSAYKLIILMLRKPVFWFAVSNAMDYMLIAIGLYFIYKKLNGERLNFSKSTAVRLVSKGKHYIVSSMMVVIFSQTDKIMIKSMLGAEQVGYYSVAVVCAGITSFVFSAIIDSMRPVIFENQKLSVEKFESSIKLLYCIVIYMSLAQSVFISFFSKYIITLIYGLEYISAVSSLRIIVWYTTFSYLGSVRNIWILSQSLQKYLWIINLSGALVNVVLNYFMIPVLGADGAAIASLVTQIFTNVIVGYIIKPIRPNNKLMVSGLNIKYFWSAIKNVNI